MLLAIIRHPIGRPEATLDDYTDSLIAWCKYASGLRRVSERESRYVKLPVGTWVTPWVGGRHLYFLAEKLAALYMGLIRRLAISFPPRHGKSHLVSRMAPAWWLGMDRGARVVVCSYGERMARKMTKFSRDVLGTSGPDVFGVTTNKQAAASDWRLYDAGTSEETGGSMRGIGVSGALTGDDVDLLACDDLYKGRAEAESPTIRESTIEWWESVPFTRLEPWTKAIVMGTRWHEEDVYGWLEDRQADGKEVGVPWEFLNIPAVADDEDDPLGRGLGEPLWPERFGPAFYEELQADLKGSPRVWASLYQGRPTPAGGDMFKDEWFRYFVEEETGTLITSDRRVDPENLAVYATLDLAFSTKTSADYTVCCVFGADLANHQLYLLHLERERVGSEGLSHWIRRVFSDWGVRRGFVEHSGFHSDITKFLTGVAGLPLQEIQPNKDKLSRAQPAAALLASGGLIFRSGAPWLKTLEHELMAFGEGCAHDDQVDAISHGVHVFHRMGGGSTRKSRRDGPRGPSRFDKRGREGGWITRRTR